LSLHEKVNVTKLVSEMAIRKAFMSLFEVRVVANRLLPTERSFEALGIFIVG
jgi:hypothetical protein